MAPTDALSAPGAVAYSSDKMSVGDGTWDFTKNDFLLPNLQGLPFEMMQYNGMGNRFSTVPQYHRLILAHGIIAVLVFLFIVPFAVMAARFHRGAPGANIRWHASLNIVAILLVTVVFVTGWFAVGPNRSLTNPHHGIGVAIYTLILAQAIGGRLVRNIRKHSLRLMIHRWGGRIVTLLGMIQIPLGLTLYGSPKVTFILYAIWMAILLLAYFVLSYRHEGDWDERTVYGGRSEVGTARSRSRYTVSDRTEKKEGHGWLGPLAAGAGVLALLKGRKDKKERERSLSRSRSRSRSRGPEVIPSRRGSTSYVDEKFIEKNEPPRGGGLMNKLFGAAGALGAGALTKKFLDRRESRKHGDEEYQSVATDTPGRNRLKRPARSEYTESEFSDEMTDLNSRVRGKPILPGPGNPTAMAAAMSAAERPERPITPRPSHARPGDSRLESTLDSDYSSYVSPSRRAREERDTGGSAGKGLLAGLGLGWFAKKLADRKDRKADADRLRYEEERRDGHHGSRYTGDGYGSPTRKPSRRYTAPAGTATTMTGDSDFSSVIDTRPTGAGHGGPPMPPLGAAGAAAAARHSRSHSRDPHGPVDMPPIPPDPHGLLHRDESVINDGYASASGGPQRRHSSRRRKDGSAAAAAAAASASVLAAEEDDRRRRRRDRSTSRAPSQPVSVKVKYHDDRDRNVTLRRLTEEEAAREHRRRRSNSISSVSGGESSSRRRYRRDSSANRTVTDLHGGRPMGGDPLSPPTPAFAGGRRPAKDSAYYSEPDHPPPPPPTGPHLTTPMRNNQTVSSIGSHGTWSAMSPSPGGPGDSTTTSAADRRRQRRMERRTQRPSGTVEFE
ncbi:Cytochrome b561/ferric reductase transmembrane [Apiospora arundinis]|uniref:Cytochrome b561/ferric reductase transmembrane n=1 Tax=Apiospora arundinis TaxID=335852 RepID=A0ABR2I0N5_9PEZI